MGVSEFPFILIYGKFDTLTYIQFNMPKKLSNFKKCAACTVNQIVRSCENAVGGVFSHHWLNKRTEKAINKFTNND